MPDNSPDGATQAFDELIETLEVLWAAIDARHDDKAFEAVTVFLVQYMNTFAHDMKLFRATYPILEELKNHIQSQHFDEANVIVLAFLAKFRCVRGGMRPD
jgi:hypothetical protein